MAEKDNAQQGASYPYVPLSSALAIADAVKQLGGHKTQVPKSLLASTLKVDEKSQGFTFRIAAAKCFGLIDGRSAYALTENAKHFYFPTSEFDKTEASLAFLSSPPAFAEMIKRFDGQKLPTGEILANIFHTQLRVPESWSVRAAQFFTRSAQLVGVIDEGGFLRFDAAMHGASKSKGEEIIERANGPQTNSTQESKFVVERPEPNVPTGYHPYELPLANGRKVTVVAPLDITAQEIKRLQKWTEFTLQVDWNGDLESE